MPSENSRGSPNDLMWPILTDYLKRRGERTERLYRHCEAKTWLTEQMALGDPPEQSLIEALGVVSGPEMRSAF